MGLHTAVELARRGHTVVATMRDTSRATGCRPLPSEAGVELDVRALDVIDHESARACVQRCSPTTAASTCSSTTQGEARSAPPSS